MWDVWINVIKAIPKDGGLLFSAREIEVMRKGILDVSKP